MAKNKKVRKMMTEENYNMIKLIDSQLEEKAGLAKMAQVTGYGMTTLSRVRNTADFSAYQEFQRSLQRKANKAKTQKQEQEPVEVEKPIMNVDSHGIMLHRIAVALETIAKHLEPVVIEEKESEERVKSFFGR